MDYGLTDAQLGAMRRAAIRGEYHLFLGAGASLDSKSRDGAGLPSAVALAQLMAAEFGVPNEEGDELWRIYARVIEANKKVELYFWLRERFHDVESPEWLRFLARCPWRTIWTLNLDDSFENAYRDVATEYSSRIRTVAWDDEYCGMTDLIVAHLHGHVMDPRPRELVFSLGEYADAAVSRAAWPITFRDLYGTVPMVIIGARLRDEPDIEAIVARRNPSHDAPNLYVNPSISAGMESDLKAWGITPVRMTGEEFSIEWAASLGVDLDQGPIRSEELALRVGRQFEELRTDLVYPTRRGHDLLGGDEPTWADITSNRFAKVDWIREGEAIIRRLGAPGSGSVALLFTGYRLSGSSTGLYALARALRRASWRVFLFMGEGRPDIDAVLRFAAEGSPMALVFDGLSDIADDVARLLEQARASAVDILVIGVDRRDNNARILGKLPEHLLADRRIRSINRRLSRTDAARIVDKLTELGRLGILEGRSDPQRIAHFRGKELFSSMATVEDAPGFGRRIDALTSDLTSSELEIVLLAAYASFVDRTLPLADIGLMLNRGSETIVEQIHSSSSLAAVLSTDGQHIRTRQRWMALRPVVQRIGEANSLDSLRVGLIRLSPRLSLSSNRSRNSTSLLAGSFMIWRNLNEVFPSQDLDGWYDTLRTTFDWSARFWEQRAIMGRHNGSEDHLARAESYARRAVSLRPDSYSYTTLGTVLAARAATAEGESAEEYFEKMDEAFDYASLLEPNNPVAWLAHLRHTIPIIAHLSNLDPKDSVFLEVVTDRWQSMYSSARSFGNTNQGLEDDLAKLKAQFDRIVNEEPS